MSFLCVAVDSANVLWRFSLFCHEYYILFAPKNILNKVGCDEDEHQNTLQVQIFAM